MSSGTNSQRILQNNQKLRNIKARIDALGPGEDPTYAELFAIADDIYNPGIPDDSATATFTIDDEQICLQKALKILRGGI